VIFVAAMAGSRDRRPDVASATLLGVEEALAQLLACLRANDRVTLRSVALARRAPEGTYAQGRRAQFGGRSRRNHSTVAYACLQSEVSSVTLAPWRAASSDTG
jgi:hypothetical protein